MIRLPTAPSARSFPFNEALEVRSAAFRKIIDSYSIAIRNYAAGRAGFNRPEGWLRIIQECIASDPDLKPIWFNYLRSLAPPPRPHL